MCFCTMAASPSGASFVCLRFSVYAHLSPSFRLHLVWDFHAAANLIFNPTYDCYLSMKIVYAFQGSTQFGHAARAVINFRATAGGCPPGRGEKKNVARQHGSGQKRQTCNIKFESTSHQSITNMPAIEVSPTSRACCAACQGAIPVGSIRVGVQVVRGSWRGANTTFMDVFYHLHCYSRGDPRSFVGFGDMDGSAQVYMCIMIRI